MLSYAGRSTQASTAPTARFIDTANVYTGGQSEEIVGRALKSLGISRQDVVIGTKVDHAMGDGPNDSGASRYHIMNQVQASLKRLGTDHIDLYQLHGWDPATPAEEAVRAIDDLVRLGTFATWVCQTGPRGRSRRHWALPSD